MTGTAAQWAKPTGLRALAMELRPILLPYQRDFIADASRVKVAVKSRRVGFTFASAAEAVFVAAGSRAAGGMDVWYMHLSQRDTRDFIAVAGRWARHLEQAMIKLGSARRAQAFELPEQPSNLESRLLYRDSKGSIRSVMVTSIKFKSGFRITGIPRDPEVLRGKNGFVIFDEAALLDLDACFAAAEAFFMSMGTPGRISLISTQRGEGNRFNQIVNEIAEGKAPPGRSLHRVTLPDAVDQGFYARDCFLRGRPWSSVEEEAWLEGLLASPNAPHEFLCQPIRDGETYFNRDLVMRSMKSTKAPGIRVSWALSEGWALSRSAEDMRREAQDWFDLSVAPHLKELPRSYQYTIGIDYGRSPRGDLEAIAITGHEIDACTDTDRHDTVVIVELYGIPQLVQELILELVGMGVPNLVGGATDAGGGGTALAEFGVHRFTGTFEALHFSRSWYELYVPAFRMAMQAGRVGLPAYEDLLDDFQMFEYVDGVPVLPKKRKQGSGRRRHGDAALAVLISFYVWLKKGGEVGEPLVVPFEGLAPTSLF